MPQTHYDPKQHCALCPRLVEFRAQNQKQFPLYFNAPVPSFGNPKTARILIVGLAPGMHGANKTGRPFTGDAAGNILFHTLKKYALATGTYAKHKNDGFTLKNCLITNAVKCLPPKNKPNAQEIKNCNQWLKNIIRKSKHITTILTLGRIAHEATLTALNQKPKNFPFKHNQTHIIRAQNITLINSYHCSRYNINTRRLTSEMFEEIIKKTAQSAKPDHTDN